MKQQPAEFKSATPRPRRVRGEQVPTERDIYDLSTPLWHKYYEAVRRGIRFPRYYKQDLNW